MPQRKRGPKLPAPKIESDTYVRCPRDWPEYAYVYAILDKGGVACDAIEHNSPEGCPNPVCWKHK